MDEEIEAVSEFFNLQSAEALGAAQRAKAHADSQAQLRNQFRAELQAKQLEVNFLQALLNDNTSPNKGLAQEYQDHVPQPEGLENPETGGRVDKRHV
ncbi:hypothetical protein MMC31_007519 [Peltigera leucophlebia]|nr:hypothetical protein [Peltigera leucophlebia]